MGSTPTPELCRLPLTEFIPAVSPDLVNPTWLAPFVDLFARVEAAWLGEGPPVKACVAVPTQHGKSATASHGLAWLIGRHPKRSHMYLSYAQALAEEKSIDARHIAKEAGVALGRETQALWKTAAGGQVLAKGVGGGITGFSASGLIVVDDPLKDSEAAASRTIRDKTWRWFNREVKKRRGNHTSFIFVASRYAQDDPSGRAIKQQGFEYINIPAINPDGTALCPERRSIEVLLEEQRDDPRGFAALMMGQPVPEGGAVFETGATCTLADIPTDGLTSIGVDLAYTAKTSADSSVAVVLRRNRDGDIYVVDVVRRQCRADEFVRLLKALSEQHPGAPMTWHGSTTERGAADIIAAQGIPLRGVLATADKLVRAQEAARRWNAHLSGGRTIYTPRNASWSGAFLEEVQGFTGVGDAHDDQVDALASAVFGFPSMGRRIGRTVRNPSEASGFGDVF